MTVEQTSWIQRSLKLRLTKAQEAQCEEWLWQLTGVWNWAIRKIELDAKDGIYHSRFDMFALVADHSQKCDIPSDVLRAQVEVAWRAWDNCFKKVARRPKFKGQRNRLNSIPCKRAFPPNGNRITFPYLGHLRFHKQEIPEGRIKQSRIVKRASGWYLCLFIEAEPNLIPITGHGEVGIDLGYSTLATLSTGEKIEHPHELKTNALRLAQAQRAGNRQLSARLREREANRRRDRNHKLSRKLVSENQTIVVSKDNLRGLARSRFGKSVASASHGELRQMLASKCTKSGRRYIEVSPKNSTRACSSCGSLSGPTGRAGLSVRDWVCTACGASHDRDVNAALNTLKLGLGPSLDLAGDRISESLTHAR